jgi:2,4-dienoyl-CoA reductase (NADPH2)
MLRQHTIDTPYLVGPVHCYTLMRDGELFLFDTGPPTREAKTYLQENLDLKKLKHIFITHCHVDHYGLAYWLEQKTDATVYLPYRDSLKMKYHASRIEMMYALLVGAGFAKSYLEDLRKVFESGALFPPFPENYKIAENDIPNKFDIQVINCPGHSQSDVVYVVDDLAVTGDTLLRGIFQSPLLDVDLETGKRFNNYNAYCRSIVKLAALNRCTVLPGHRRTIDSIEESIHFYISKLLLRVEQILPFRDERNIAKIIETVLNKSMTDVFHIYLKASEILFMQDFLAHPEKLGDALRVIGLFDKVADQFNRITGR